MKKITKNSLLAVLTLGILSQVTLQAMDQTPADDHSNNSVLAPFFRQLNRVAGTEIVNITPRVHNTALAAPADDQDNATNSVVINMGNNALALSRSTPRTIANNYRAMRQQLTFDTQDRIYYSAVLSGAYAMVYGASNALHCASRYLNDRSASDALIAGMIYHYTVMIAGGYLHWNASDIAEAYGRAQRLPAAQQGTISDRIANLLRPVTHEQNTCIVCRDDIDANAGVKLPTCNHIHHRNCIMQWLLTQHNQGDALRCPHCRTLAAVRVG